MPLLQSAAADTIKTARVMKTEGSLEKPDALIAKAKRTVFENANMIPHYLLVAK
jgi:hypothetical protein